MTTPRIETADMWPTHANEWAVGAALRYVALPGTEYFVPARFSVNFGDPRLPYDVELDVAMKDSGPECLDLNLRRRPDGPPVTSTAMRSLPLAHLLEQGARFMAYERTTGDDGTVKMTPARLDADARDRVSGAWRFAKAAPRRKLFPANIANLERVGVLVQRALEMAQEERRRPTVYADVEAMLGVEGIEVSRATVQRRIEAAQTRGYAPRWKKAKP